MQSLICPSCGAHLEYEEKKFLECAYCSSKFFNEYYNKSAEEVSEEDIENSEEYEDSEEEIYLDDVCIEFLTDLIKETDIGDFDVEIGMPLETGKKLPKARENFKIPAEDDVYLIFDSTVFGGCQRGFALCSSGFYYSDDHLSTGMYTWEEFIDEEISFEDGDLQVFNAYFLAGDSNTDLADFLIDFHDQVYDYWYEEEE